MLITPKLIGKTALTKDELRHDKDNCLKSGPCGVGKKAIYLNSFYIDRMYYVCYEDIDRIFKRVAMSRGGFTGKGLFGSIPYLVVQMKDGTQKQCNFKVEDHVDATLTFIEKEHPEIRTHSEAAEKKLAEAKAAEEARWVKNLSKDAVDAIETLEKAGTYLRTESSYSTRLSQTAKKKRETDGSNPAYAKVAAAIFAGAAAGVLVGVWGLYQSWNYTAVFVPFALAAIAFMIGLQVRPTGRTNKEDAQKAWDAAVANMEHYLKDAPGTRKAGFPVPAQYAHPVVIDRMIRVIREGRATSAADALETVKKDLKALNSSVKVSQQEYDEVVAVKPMFLVCSYN